MEKPPLILWYPNPAGHWVEALPVGNGRLGAMVFGGVISERIQLNEDTLWSGGPRSWNNPGAPGHLAEARRLISAEKYDEADAVCQRMQGPYNQSYLPLGNLSIELTGLARSSKADFYYRELDLDQAVATTHFDMGGVRYSREVFASFPDQVIVIQLKASRSGQLSFETRLDSLLQFDTRAAAAYTLILTGRCPINVDPDYLGDRENPVCYDEDPDGEGMRFEIQLAARTIGGLVSCDGSRLVITGASEATLLLSAATSFNGYDRLPGSQGLDPTLKAGSILHEALNRSTSELRARHVTDHQRLFRRVELHLGDTPHPDSQLPTDERLQRFKINQDQGLTSLLFQYGRYLLIASSRPGTQPANLQGIWSHEIRPPWSSNWTLNINTEMNYWPAETCNLAECHEPLLDFIVGLAANGSETARVNYGLDGWVAHHNADLWRQSAPVGNFSGDPVWANWPMGGAWLCQHLWEHYRFNRDKTYLREFAYPLMKGAAEFCLGWLIEDGQGQLATAPSFSPELRFYTPSGKTAAASMAATMDMAIIWDLFSNCMGAAGELGIDAQFTVRLAAALKRLVPYQVGERGQLQEWSQDFTEQEVHHRHLSHLFGLHPGRQIDPEQAPELANAIRRSLELRGDAGTGWSLGWKINLWARLLDSERAYQTLHLIFNPVDLRRTIYGLAGGLYPNLFGAHPPFQIDGNFSFTAGVAEMLVQSQQGVIHLLPALPAAWPEGYVRGLRVRGGFDVDIIWRDEALTQAKITSRQGGRCRVKAGRPVQVMEVGIKIACSDEGGGVIAFDTQRGQVYLVVTSR